MVPAEADSNSLQSNSPPSRQFLLYYCVVVTDLWGVKRPEVAR